MSKTDSARNGQPATTPDHRGAATATPKPFGKLSDTQVVLVLEQIATDANTLQQFAAQATVDAGVSEHADRCHVMQMIAERIGAMADFACGEGIVGNVGNWTCGPLFNDAREVHHGH